MKKIIQVSIYDLEGHMPMELIEQAWFVNLTTALDFAEPALSCTSLCVKFTWIDDFTRGCAM